MFVGFYVEDVESIECGPHLRAGQKKRLNLFNEISDRSVWERKTKAKRTHLNDIGLIVRLVGKVIKRLFV